MNEPDILRFDDDDVRGMILDPPAAFRRVVRQLVDAHRAGGVDDAETRRVVRDSYEWAASFSQADEDFIRVVETPDGPKTGISGPGMFRRLLFALDLDRHDLVAVDAYRRVVATALDELIPPG